MKDHDLMVIGVAVPHDPPPAVIARWRNSKPGYPIALDVHGEISKAFGGIKVTPTTFLIDPDGNINYSERGHIRRDTYPRNPTDVSKSREPCGSKLGI